MKTYFSKIFLSLVAIIFTHQAMAMRGQDWYVPEHSRLQYAGSIGTLSVSLGWSYGKQTQWESDLIYGCVLGDGGSRTMDIATIKQSYVPWDKPLVDNVSFNPLVTSVFISLILGGAEEDTYWLTEPEHYGSYYRFPTRARAHLGIGQRLNYNFAEREFLKYASVYYEISTCDLQLVSAATNRALKPSDYLSLAFGVRFVWGD